VGFASGSPLAFTFLEQAHQSSVAVLDETILSRLLVGICCGVNIKFEVQEHSIAG
jgi:hypothetical protein